MKTNIAKEIRVQKLQNKNRMTGQTFNVLGNNERRINPWLGSVWFEKGMDAERAERIKEWKEETKRLLKINPKLKLVK
jgi:hypothetical protein